MPKREEDPSLLGTIIEFDPIQEERRYQEEEEQRRKLTKKRHRKLKKDDSSKCSGATASTSKSNNSTAPVPDKIVTTIISEETEEDAKSSSSSRENKKDEKKKKSKSERRNDNLRKCKSEHDLTQKDLKKAKSKKSIKKQEKRQRRAARNIQRIARGYWVRRDLEEQRQQEEEVERQEKDEFDHDEEETSCEQQETASLQAVERQAVLVEDASDDETSCEEQEVEEPTLSAPLPGETEIEAGSEAVAATTPNNNNNNNNNKKTPRRLGARIRQAIKRTRTPRKEAAASRLQNAFRLFQVRRLFQKGDKQRWRTAWQRFFVFSVFSPLEGMRQKQRLMQGPAVPPNQREESEQEFDVSDSTTDQDLDIIPLSLGPASPVAKSEDKEHQEQEPDLLDAIPEDKAHCERVVANHLLAPLPSFADSDCSINSEELMSDMISPASPSTVTTHFTAGSLSPRRVVVNASKKSKPVTYHSSCPVLRFDTV